MADDPMQPNTPQELPEEFEVLRGMESYSQEMFNRIIEFQEKDHPAWNTDAPFSERIASLPLHALIFSNPDRDPALHAHTIAPFYPLREEIRGIAQYIKKVGSSPVVCDIHGRNGFLASLLGQEGLNVVALKDPDDRPNQIHPFHDPAVCTLREQSIDEIDFPIDVALSAWMPAGQNRTPAILNHKPGMVIFIYTEHRDEVNALPQTGTPEAFTDLPESYEMIAEWSITRPKDVLHEAWPDLTPSIEETRQVRIFADKALHIDGTPAPEEPLPMTDKYAWEADLEMALTVFRAKAYLRQRGHSV